MASDLEGDGAFGGENNALFESPEYQNLLKQYRTKIQRWLTPYETWIMRIQCILVWEKPLQSAILLLVFNILFW